MRLTLDSLPFLLHFRYPFLSTLPNATWQVDRSSAFSLCFDVLKFFYQSVWELVLQELILFRKWGPGRWDNMSQITRSCQHSAVHSGLGSEPVQFLQLEVLGLLSSQCKAEEFLKQCILAVSEDPFLSSFTQRWNYCPRRTWITAGNNLFGVICEAIDVDQLPWKNHSPLLKEC